MTTAADPVAGLLPYVPDLVLDWAPTGAAGRHMRVEGSLAFVDISGFTKLTERLARHGKVGAEEMSDVLSATFSALITDAHADGADLVKWGGDAVLLLFRGEDHAARAARAAHRMRATLRWLGRLPTATVTLRMSIGIHSGAFDFFLVGDPDLHRELLISGPGASHTAEMEAAARAGQIGLSAATAALLPPRLLGAPLLDGRLLRTAPDLPDLPEPTARGGALEPASVLSHPIRDHLLHDAGDPEHRLIAVAFVQFSGTDALLTSEGPNALADALDHVVRTVQRACADNGVTFFETDINRDGGKVMLTAGAPRSAGHDEERMLRVARQVLDGAGRLPLRIGINRGRVFAGDFGPDFRRTYSVKGDAINLAARVMGKAAPGQVLATVEAVDHSQTLFETTPLEPFLVKGKSAAVHAVAVGALAGARVPERVAGPLNGRATELDGLRAALADIRSRKGRLVDIVGEPGMGKSRLIDELLSGAPDVPVAFAPCEEYESSTAYFPFRSLLRDLAGVPADSRPAEVERRLVDRVGANAPELVPWLPLLGLPMDVPLTPTPEVVELDAQFRTSRLEAVVTDLLTHLAPVPTIFVVDDAHLMDDASIDLLRTLTSGLAARPWLVIVTRQEGEGGFVPEGEAVVRIPLRPLSPEASLEFVRTALVDHPLTDQALAALAERGGGNPIFLEALVQEVLHPSGTADLPESVEGLVTSQVDRLDPADRTVLRYAAVLGTVIDEEALGMLVGDHSRADLLRRLAGFLVKESSGRLRFRNALIRDVAYEGLPFSRRKVLHEQVGTAIEQSSSPESNSELLSLHFFHAGRFDRAWRYSVLAGERALAKYAHRDAIDFLRRAVDSAGSANVDPLEVAEVLEQLADSCFLIGDTDAAERAYAQARQRVRGEPVRSASIIEKEARIDHRRRRLTRAMQRISRGLHELDGVEGRRAEVARSLLARRYAFSRYRQGRVDDALSWARIAAEAADRARDPDALAQAHEMLNAIYAGSGRREPLPYGRKALRAYVRLGNLPRQGHCLNNLAVQAFGQGRWNDALADYRRAAEIFRRIGDSANESNALYNQAELLVRQGRDLEAGPLLVEVLRNARAVEDEELVALALREQARVLSASARVDEAVAGLREARDLFTALDEASEVLATDLVLAEVLLNAERTDRALELLGVVIGSDPVRLEGAAPTALRLQARARAVQGDLAEARRLLADGLAAARAGGDRYEEGLLLRTLAGVNVGLGQPYKDALRRSTRVLLSMGVVDVQPTLTRASLSNKK